MDNNTETKRFKMMTAAEALQLSDSYNELDNLLRRIHDVIKVFAMRGRRGAFMAGFGDFKKSPLKAQVEAHMRELGYEIEYDEGLSAYDIKW